MDFTTSRPQDSITFTPPAHNLPTMSPSISNAERNKLLAELRKNSIPEVETVQDLYKLYFPRTLTLASESMRNELWALGCSIEHQLDIPQKPGDAIRRGLAQMHENLMTIVPGYLYFTVLDKMGISLHFYLLLFGYKRRLAIIEPEGFSNRFVARIPYEDHTVGDHRYEDVIWLYHDDRRAKYYGCDPLFAGVCIPERDWLPYHRGCILDKSSPSVFDVIDSQTGFLIAGPSFQIPTPVVHICDGVEIDVETFLDLCLPDTDDEDGEATYGPTPQIPPRPMHPNDTDVSSIWSTTEEEVTSSDEDEEDSEVAFPEPDPAPTHSHDADIDNSSSILRDPPGEDDNLTSPQPTSAPQQPMPPPNVPTGPATVCWNCSGIGHLSSKFCFFLPHAQLYSCTIS